MSEGHGVLLHDRKDRTITGYLTIGDKQYWIYGERVSDIRMNLKVCEASDDDGRQGDMFSELAGERKYLR